MNGTDAWMLVGFVALPLLAGGLGSLATTEGVRTWYPDLEKPAWTPPSWLFGPVWSALYVLMGVAAWLVWREAGWSAGRWPLGLWGAQLVLNALWSFLFFGWQRPGLALVEIVVLWVAIAATAVAFWPVSRLGAWLLAPYLAWVSFASALNFAIWRLNG